MLFAKALKSANVNDLFTNVVSAGPVSFLSLFFCFGLSINLCLDRILFDIGEVLLFGGDLMKILFFETVVSDIWKMSNLTKFMLLIFFIWYFGLTFYA